MASQTIPFSTLALVTLLACNAPRPLPVRFSPQYPETSSISASCLKDFISLDEAERRVQGVIKFGDPALTKVITDDWSSIRGTLSPLDKIQYWEKKIGAKDYLSGICVLHDQTIKSCIFLGRTIDFSHRP